MFLSRILRPDGRPAVIVRQGREAALLKAAPGDPPLQVRSGTDHPVAEAILQRGLGDPVDVDDLSAQGRLLLPVWSGQSVQMPLAMGELPLPLIQVPPGKGIPVAPGLTIEGGIAALVFGSVIGWVQFHLVTSAALGHRHLCFGPEIALGDDIPSGGGTGVLSFGGGGQRNFPLPPVGRGDAVKGDAVRDDAVKGDANPPDAPVLRRLSRWLIRPSPGQALAALQSHHIGVGLPLRNPLYPAPGVMSGTTMTCADTGHA